MMSVPIHFEVIPQMCRSRQGRTASMQLNFMSVLLLLVVTCIADCPDGSFLTKRKICCKLCPAGTYLELPCVVNQTHSKCKPCPVNTFARKANQDKKCRPCTTCTPSQIEDKPCEKTADTECGCPDGMFLDMGLLFCVNCSLCAVGYGVVSNCSSFKDTECAPCENGTFSDQKNREACKLNSTSKPMTHPTPSTSVPASVPTSVSASVTLSGSTRSTKGTAPAPNGASSITAVTVFLTVIVSLIFVILVLLIFYVRKWLCCRRYASQDLITSVNQNMATEKNVLVHASKTPAQHRSSKGLRGRHRYSRSSVKESASEGSSGSLKDVQVTTLQPSRELRSLGERGKMLVRDLPGDVIGDLAYYLNPKGTNDWTHLAGHLGFTHAMIENIKLEGQSEGLQNLLREWGIEPNSTINKLHSTLMDMRREDAMSVLEDFCRPQ